MNMNKGQQQGGKKMSSDNTDGTTDTEDYLQKAYGDWSETIVRVDRVQKVQRGGTMVRYRALVIGGNLNGCAGFGVAKANAPNEAAALAARVAKRNIFFIDRYLGSGLTSDLAGRQNSCRVSLRSVNPNRGLHGHPLICEILKYFGITDCTAKSHGNRNVHNVVRRATFKAIMTHESLEDVAMKRGKRLMNLERAKRLKI
jgi:small subunit ribosomal protein S5